FENKLPLGALLAQLQAEQEATDDEETAKDVAPPVENKAETKAEAPAAEASKLSPSQVSDSWARAATSEWNQIDEIISSGQTPQPDDETSTDKK
ncbi:MAG TPA: hypothetical protein PKW11_15690, partial [Pseudomonadota bacterium]|nr:hypothetical protein [Pseudomonadota bacterium]